jgi:hypothetical protein
MSNPEISRRCSSCGASIREIAHFCPQCGKELPKRDATETHSPLFAAELTTSKNTEPLDSPEASAEQTTSEATPVQPKRPSMSDTIAIEHPPKSPSTSTSDTIAIERPQPTAKTNANPRVRGAVGAGLQRAGTIARGVEGNVIHRVQKAREISSVVIDEAGYDPSLRFVLVAAALFVLFLLIVLLNKVIT